MAQNSSKVLLKTCFQALLQPALPTQAKDLQVGPALGAIHWRNAAHGADLRDGSSCEACHQDSGGGSGDLGSQFSAGHPFRDGTALRELDHCRTYAGCLIPVCISGRNWLAAAQRLVTALVTVFMPVFMQSLCRVTAAIVLLDNAFCGIVVSDRFSPYSYCPCSSSCLSQGIASQKEQSPGPQCTNPACRSVMHLWPWRSGWSSWAISAARKRRGPKRLAPAISCCQ